MSTETTDELKCKPVPTPGVVESSCSFENTIKPSNEFVEIFKITYIFSRDKSKNNLKQIKTMEIKMKKLFHKVYSQDTKVDDVITLAYTYQHICYAYIMFHQEKNLPAAKDFILRCLHLIKNIKLGPKIIMLTLRAHGQLGSIYDLQHKPENALEIFNKGLDLYLIYMEEHSQDEVLFDYEDIIIKSSVAPANNYVKLKCLYKFILRRSIHIHTRMGSKPNERFMLTYHLFLTDEFNCLQTTKLYKQWCEKARIVFDYLIMCNRFPEANSYIATIIFVKKFYLYPEYIHSKEKKLPSKELLLEECFATFKLITLCLARYGVALFRQSVERLLRLEKDEVSKDNDSTTKYPSKSKERRLFLSVLNEKAHNDSSTYYNIIPFTYILNYNNAQRFFYSILSSTCKLEQHFMAIDVKFYIPFILYTSNMYKYVAFYEKDTATRLLLRRRRAEILKIAAYVLEDKNCKLLRLLWLQLTIAYSTLIDMKIDDLEAAPLRYLPQRHDTLVDEINDLVENCLIFLRMYICYK